MITHPRARQRLQLNHLALCVGMAIPLLAQAQIADQNSPVLPQVEVTADKMGDTTEGTGSYTTGRAKTALPLSMSLRDTPQSVSVVTQQRIEDQGLVTITDVINNVAGVSVNQYETNRAGFTARGFDITNLQIDGVPTTWEQPWSSGEVAGSLAIYDRVEVVRGATGLMTGAGNPSAAINLVRKRATSRELTGTAEIGVGRFNERRALVDVSTPLTQAGNVRARVVGEYQKADSWIDAARDTKKTVYATVEADLTPQTLLSAGFSRQETEPKGPMWGGLPYWYTDGSRTNWAPSKTSAADWADWPTSYNNGFVDLEHTFDNGWKVRATYSHGDRKSDSHLLYLSGVPDRATGLGMSAFAGSYATHTKQDNAGLHASGPFELGGRKHEAAFGYMYSNQKFNANSRTADFGAQPSGVGDFNAWNAAAFPNPAWGPQTFYEGGKTKEEGWYAVARLSLADPLKLILGARMTDYQKDVTLSYSAPYTMKYDREVTPYAGLVYDLNDTYSTYVSYTDIFQPQSQKDLAGATLDPIIGKSYEAGVKGEHFGGRLNTSLAVFRIKQDNLAQEVDTVTRPGQSAPEAYYRGAEGATSTGIELEASGELARGWNANVSYTQFKAEDATGATVNSIYPRKLIRLYTTYKLPGQLSGLTVGGGVNWEGRTDTTDPNAPAGTNGRIEQDSFSVVNLMARYDITPRLSAQVNIDNAFDKKHFGMFAAYGAITYAAPRTASVSLKYRF